MSRDSSENGNGLGVAAMPPWLRFVVVVGPTAAIALFLVFQVPGAIKQVEARVEQHATTTVQSNAATAAQLGELIKSVEAERQQLRVVVSVLRQVCVNTARNDEQRRECVQ
jgi:hypothetical protein